MKKWFLLVLLIVLFVLFHFFHLYQYFTFDSIKTSQILIKEWTQLHYWLALLIYLLIFIATIAATIPTASFLTIVAGFLFGTMGILYAIAGTTLGGLVLFCAVRSAFGSYWRNKVTGRLKNIEKGFQQNAFYYILMMRLFPVFPCWISNIGASVLGVPVKTFLAATIIGITPAAIIYVMIGKGLEEMFANNQEPSLSILLTPAFLIPLLALAILSVIPVFYKGIKNHYR